MEKLVANPRHQELERALAGVRARGEILQAALDPAFTLFAGQGVWVGPAAKLFQDALTRHRKLLKSIVDDVIDQLDVELGRTKREVPERMARTRPT